MEHPNHAPARGAAPSGTADGVRSGPDLAAQVSLAAEANGVEAGSGPWLGPRHTALLDACRCAAVPVAELAAEAGLSVPAVRALIGDLLRYGCVTVSPPAPLTGRAGARVLSEVIDALRAL